ncbi:ECF subfamily RNA polymerase sigma factor [Kitasatospora aureofaciens]|nr:ECF subfamily RNA polymerase sigma factor [Kitasatospora aureofaciens]
MPETRRPAEHREDRWANFAEFYDQQMARLIRHLMRQGASMHEAAEAAQAAFTEALMQWERIKYPAAWVRLVAQRLYLRQSARREDLANEIPDTPGNMCPLRQVELGEEESRVYSTLASLPPHQRTVMAWHLDGFSTADIGKALSMSPEAVRQNLNRSRSRLKTILLDWTDGGGR